MNIEEIIRAVQTELGIGVDGKAGPNTWEAIFKKIVPKKEAAVVAPALTATVGTRSEKCIATLHPKVQPFARALVLKAKEAGITIQVISGLRTYDEQNALYAKGRTAGGSKVTNAPGGYSNHNFGVAFDIGVFDGTKYVEESPRYKAVGALGMQLGLEWGGNWKTIEDQPHFQLRPEWAGDMREKDMLAELRSRKDSGKDFFA